MKKVVSIILLGLLVQACSKPTHELKSPCTGNAEPYSATRNA